MIAVASIFVLGSCGKYEEGPGFSLRSKKARVTGEWTMVKYSENGVDEPLDADDKDDTWIIDKDGTWEITDPGSGSDKGTWEFSDDKEKFEQSQDFNGASFTIPATILRLTNSEFWLEYDFDGDKTEVHFEKK